jgi:lipid-binding SYLF domain-containing protein
MKTLARCTPPMGPAVKAVVCALGIVSVVVGALGAWADAALDAAQLAEKAKIAVESLAADSNLAAFHDMAKRAKGVFMAPELLKAAFVVGASGGSGVLVVRDEKTGKWHGPAFYTLGAASFGLQIGAEASEVAVLAMTERGVTAMLQPSVKLGADASVAAGPVGLGASAATANVSADLVSFSHSKGLYGGVSLEGAVLAVRNEWNNSYYGKTVTPTDILVRGEATRPGAAGLIAAVSKLAGR